MGDHFDRPPDGNALAQAVMIERWRHDVRLAQQFLF
jgi:hypothetical protein